MRKHGPRRRAGTDVRADGLVTRQRRRMVAGLLPTQNRKARREGQLHRPPCHIATHTLRADQEAPQQAAFTSGSLGAPPAA